MAHQFSSRYRMERGRILHAANSADPMGSPYVQARAWSATERYVRKLASTLELPPGVRLHDLRHSCVAALVAANVGVRTIMEIVGHRNSSATMAIHAQILPAGKRLAADNGPAPRSAGGSLMDRSGALRPSTWPSSAASCLVEAARPLKNPCYGALTRTLGSWRASAESQILQLVFSPWKTSTLP